MTNPSAGARLRALIQRGSIAVAPGCYDGLTARLVEQAGFEAAYMSGLCVAATLGEPDVGAISVDAMVERARIIAQSTSLPLIVDADSGYGGAYNVFRATRAFEAAGAAALHLEDQPFPKKCAAMPGKTLVGAAEMVARIRVALEARTDPDFMIIARTDAFAVEGLDAAIARAQVYEQAGADATIIMSVAAEADMARITASLKKPTIVMMVENLRPLVPAARLQAIGYPLVVYPVSLLQGQVHAQARMLAALREDGSTAASAAAAVTLGDIAGHLDLPRASRVDADYARYVAQARDGVAAQ
ncbi:isocitrate lyase/PEP mutase family protein [Cupriavidus basilensis]|uniref:isocitrate lyase/PEP mutase family protein n=1 Tax=Cupriavidus basilensis TaxID=68895 RepID=UPI0007512F50|nr:isocitrate lyase/phosphoenolpyruvate mutase family protein [Cupriavidus basilensis]